MHESIALRPAVFALLLLCALAGFAQAPPRPQRVVAAPVPPVTVTRGKPAKVELDFRVVPGFHINSNQPKDELLVPTAVRFEPPTDIVIAKVTYPEGQDMTFEFLPGEKLNVYTGDFAVTAMVSTTKTISPGTYRVHASLKYQACDNRQCYPPGYVPVDFDVKVKKLAPAAQRNPAQSPHVHR